MGDGVLVKVPDGGGAKNDLAGSVIADIYGLDRKPAQKPNGQNASKDALTHAPAHGGDVLLILSRQNERALESFRSLYAASSPRSPEDQLQMQKRLKRFNELLEVREKLETFLPDNRAGELRRMRRDFANAGGEIEQQRIRNNIDTSFPQMAGINLELKQNATAMSKLDTVMQTYKRDPLGSAVRRDFDTQIRPVLPSHLVLYDPYDLHRRDFNAKIESFYQPRPDDEFGTVWQRIKDDSFFIKSFEVLKHLPRIKISFEKPEDIVKMFMMMSGIEPSQKEMKMTNGILSGVKSIEKQEGGTIVLARDGNSFVPLLEPIHVGAGISVKGIEFGTIRARLDEGKTPALDQIEGVTVKLEVPKPVARIGIHSETSVRQLSLEPGSSGWTVFATVDNPVPPIQRQAIGFIIRDVPQEDLIKVPILRLDREGRPVR